MTSEKKSSDIVLELLLMMYGMRVRLLTLGIIIFILSFLVFMFFFIRYSSTVTFLIDNSAPSEIAASETERFVLSQLHELSNNRMYLILFSDEMAKRLDDEIRIGMHYGLNEKDPRYIGNILSLMHSNVDMERGISNTVKITVKDHSKEFAAAFANSIYSNLVDINKKIVYSNLNYKKETYRIDMEHLDSQNKKDMEKFLAELNKLQTTDKRVRENTDEMFLLKRDLFHLFTQYNFSSSEMKKSALKYQMSSGAMNDTTLQNLYLINRAYPGSNTGAYVRASFWSLGFALAGIFYYSFSLFFFQRMKVSFRELIMYNGNSGPQISVPAAGAKKNFNIAEEVKAD